MYPCIDYLHENFKRGTDIHTLESVAPSLETFLLSGCLANPESDQGELVTHSVLLLHPCEDWAVLFSGFQQDESLFLTQLESFSVLCLHMVLGGA
jgi:hypothetical protein